MTALYTYTTLSQATKRLLLQNIYLCRFVLPRCNDFLHIRKVLCYNRWQESNKWIEPIVRTL